MLILTPSKVKFAGTAGIKFEALEEHSSVLSLKNRFWVQNHIKGVHACGMALLAETATGSVIGMNVPDSCIPLLKSMTVEYLKVAKGDLKGVATLDEEQRRLIRESEKGELVVPVKITDSEGKEPIRATMLWAWIPRTRKAKAE
ncbi:hypothetical protein GUITHDRAFT_62618 [Guillardia theta CCMP2712]|uniref:DUF4442 domain-containing protein n=1 Tax=Guillardia theta (strain CCMP2712) TaxID=905079 RepID=L1K3R8_GUITC|nr:hypothetical protein GUITHDRAFT_62618 [Guillardia theta CCMP2712]EKX55456.1 hypothetical protein GUITHDRAFT_62618 [Guillardia theta CCMP2712]|eukprot:XP_005842436.1 hypothetical protein GUITHDRAFT_62618 [Guillardia theta CCMP2712]